MLNPIRSKKEPVEENDEKKLSPKNGGTKRGKRGRIRSAILAGGMLVYLVRWIRKRDAPVGPSIAHNPDAGGSDDQIEVQSDRSSRGVGSRLALVIGAISALAILRWMRTTNTK